jgi:hypothetical protein
LTWPSTVHVNPPPLTDSNVRLASFQPTYSTTLACATAAAAVVKVIVVPPTFSDFLPRLLSNPIADVEPEPESRTCCGLPDASSATCTLAERGPAADGLKVTLTVQVAFTASVAGANGQLLDCAKSARFAPATPIELIDNTAEPEFRTTTDNAPLVVPTNCDPNTTLDGDNDTPGAVPVPLTATLCGLPAALSLTAILAARVPVADGAKLTLIEQVAFTASVEGEMGQSVVIVKSPACAPAAAMLEIASGAVPVFFNVDDCAAPVVPTSCEPKPRLVGVRLTAGAGVVPVPVSAMLCGLAAASSVTLTLAGRLPAAVGRNATEIVHVLFTASVAGDNGHVFVEA